MVKTVYLIDFDGTMVDVWIRYYEAYVKATHTDISFHDYVCLKRELEQDSLVAGKFGRVLPDGYRAEKQRLLESSELLEKDTLLLNDLEINKLLRRNDIYIFTKRRNKELFFLQLDKLGLGGFKDKAIVVDSSQYNSKEDYLKSNFIDKKVVVIGDSEDDARCSLLSNVFVFLVSTGLRNPKNVENFEKCRIVNSVLDVNALFS